MKMRFLVLAVLSVLAAGCATPKVKPQGAAVEIIGDLGFIYNGASLEPQFDQNARPKGVCVALGAVTGRDETQQKKPLDLGGQIRLLAEAKNNLRDNAAAMGGNVAHIQSAQTAASGSMSVSGTAYKCQ